MSVLFVVGIVASAAITVALLAWGATMIFALERRREPVEIIFDPELRDRGGLPESE